MERNTFRMVSLADTFVSRLGEVCSPLPGTERGQIEKGAGSFQKA